jgi:hypothetical protein
MLHIQHIISLTTFRSFSKTPTKWSTFNLRSYYKPQNCLVCTDDALHFTDADIFSYINFPCRHIEHMCYVYRLKYTFYVSPATKWRLICDNVLIGWTQVWDSVLRNNTSARWLELTLPLAVTFSLFVMYKMKVSADCNSHLSLFVKWAICIYGVFCSSWVDFGSWCIQAFMAFIHHRSFIGKPFGSLVNLQ